MARRRRQNSLLADAFKENWPFSAVLAVIAIFFGHLLIPSLFSRSPLVGPIGGVFTIFADVCALIFGTIALFKFSTAPRSVSLTGNPTIFPTSPTPQRREPAGNRRRKPLPDDLPVSPAGNPQFPRSDAVSITVAEKPTAWSLEVLQNIEWKLFEDLCAAYCREKGIRCDTTALGPDGGIDIRLYQDAAQPAQTTAIVQCKAMRIVGIKPMRELLGVMAHEKLEKGFFMTSGEFTADTKAFGQQNRIVPIDGKLLLAMILRLPAEAQARLLALGTHGAWNIPSCPECGRKMIRKDPVGKKPFWSCAVGRCKGRLDMRHERF